MLYMFMSLQSIARSECPHELEPVDRKIRVHVDLVKREDNYIVNISFPCLTNTVAVYLSSILLTLLSL